MPKILWKLLLASPAILGAAWATSANAQSVPSANRPADNSSTLQQVGAYGAEGQGDSFGQVTSVSQFSDVRPTDWAFQALQSLVERYGCIVGYPDKTYRGNRATTRYEFAAGLNACLDKIQELIAAATSDFVRKEDLEVMKKLQEEFAAELAVLRGRVDALEVRTATLEKQQFSTTTKLSGEVIFAVADTFGDRATRTGNDSFLAGVNAANEGSFEDETETIFADRVRLSLDTSFSGKDRLRTRLEAKNIEPFRRGFTGTNETRLAFDGGSGAGDAADNSVRLDKLYYRFPIGDKLRIQIDAINDEVYDGYVNPLSPFESSGQGAVSRFGRFNPIYRLNNPGTTGSAGVTFEYKFSDALLLQGGYLADPNSNDPGRTNGIFNGQYTAIGQLVFRPTRTIDVGLTYARSYYPGNDATNITGSTGSGYAANPFLGSAMSTDSFGLQLQWRLTPKITIGGWGGYTRAYRKTNSDEAEILNWAAFLALPDFGRKGNLLGFLVGSPPKVTDTDFRANAAARRRLDEESTLHIEAFYRFRVTDNISITPGAFVLINPEGNDLNDTQFVGVVRTTFTF
ncbi:MAG: iron uptake porin [Leptolyngbyaceae cyanobacterium RU_5_1]|nr:iron uptake porin [Leptolyngbyaceae cyanobacterium RU_5_1]